MTDSLTRRGPNANRPVRLPGLQTSRVADPNVRQALNALREWVEVRLGSRGDAFERAVTTRELTQLLDVLSARIEALEKAAKEISDGTSAATDNTTKLVADLNAMRTSLEGSDATIRAELNRISTRLSKAIGILGIDA